ncbi:MAG: DUF554 domain-containing protein [Anaerolineae bacterium]|jgi:uncharacterized protein|nr:DUF554 domain-containing protein [Anaerolineae bacterium]MBT7072279.1 DUF554 domain-containing protein [Anaerolineae bacterium]MBT7326096.1 DUF554 domain-containing protein [Anaerolineae bacterium]MBT7601761.1 DUF554 domain-containing protein [Anaerolineae bacterium]
MTGTIINVIAVLIGSSLGMLFGSRLPDRLKNTVTAGLGLFTISIGLSMFLKTEESLVVLGGLLIGAVLGEWWQIEEGLANLGAWLESRFGSSKNAEESNRFIRGFLTASLLFCIGPLAILGSIQDGLVGDYELLAVKSVLDAFASLAFASTLGVGVAFSALAVLIYQGSITLLAAQLNAVVTEPMMTEMTAVGGVILIGLALSSLLEIKKIRVSSFLPALVVTPLIVYILALF